MKKVKMIQVGNKITPPFFKGEEIKNIACTDVTLMGYGVLKPKNFTVFAKGIIPGESGNLKIEKLSKNFAIAKVDKIINPSESRIEPLCKYSKNCNGCKYQHIAYSKQVEIKESQLEDIFSYKLKVIKSQDQYFYRNKSNFTISNKAYNMYGDNNTLVKIDKCVISHQEINKIMPALLESINNNKKAEVKEVIFRYSQYEDSLMIILVSEKDNYFAEKIAQEIVGYSSKVKSVILSHGESRNYLFNEGEKVLYGEDYIVDKLFNKLFKITSKSFYQINLAQTEKLYQTVIDFGNFSQNDNVLDLYCGVGSIGIILSDYVNHVLGVEVLEEAVASARENINLNDINNVEIIKHDLKESLKISDNIDCIIVDPPRSGLSDKVINTIIESKVKKLIYVSCNPLSQVRDLDKILKSDYNLVKHKAVDMFVNTEHIESVVMLEKKTV